MGAAGGAGTYCMLEARDELAFATEAPVAAGGVAVKHAHSKDNPEADWGRHVKQAAQFALHALDEAVPDAAPFTFDNTRVIAVGISRSEEHTSELQSLMRISYAVFCLKKKTKNTTKRIT